MDNIFLLTLFFIFATTFASTYIARLVRDRCLHDFQDFAVTVELKDGARYWGELRTFSNGIEVAYDTPYRRDSEGHVEASAIFLKDRIGNIQAIYRYHDELSKEDKRRREIEVENSYHPALHRQLRRAVRNFVNTFRDAISESIGFIVARVKQTSSSQVVQTQDARLTQVGNKILDTAARQAFEPILELYIGRRVVAEELRPEEQTREHAGILKDYTAEWLELLDCRLSREFRFNLAQPARLQLNKDLDFIVRKIGPEGTEQTPGLAITVENHGNVPVVVLQLEAEGYRQGVGQRVGPGESFCVETTELPPELFEGSSVSQIPRVLALRAAERGEQLPASVLAESALPPLVLVIQATRTGDVCLPRTHSFVKHGAEPIGEGWLRENWREFYGWSRRHRVGAAGHLLWTLANAVLAGFVAWTLLALIWDFVVGVLVGSLLAGLVFGTSWLLPWSASIRGQTAFAGWLRARLLVVSGVLVSYAGLYGYYQ